MSLSRACHPVKSTMSTSLSDCCCLLFCSTGNPRNKVALRPGYSLMDWIRLTKSGKDLAGTRGRILSVTPAELRKHNKKNDAWMALNGKVLKC